MTFQEYLLSLPALQGNRPDGQPIENGMIYSIGERGHFFTLAKAASEVERIEAMLPAGMTISEPTPTPDNGGYRPSGESAKLKRYEVEIDGHTYDLGSLIGFVSTYPGFPAEVSEYGMKGTLEAAPMNPAGIFLKFTPAPEVKRPQVAPVDAPPGPPRDGYEWIKVLTGWAEVPKNALGLSESKINLVLEAVGKALRGK